MMDFNSSVSVSGQITALIDIGMQRVREQQPARDYLGASRLGIECERALATTRPLASSSRHAFAPRHLFSHSAG